ncbi:hypothetical protein [Streptomyces sp. NPDC005799]|uniref:hypothetical protein n=1 Tax=Streptomyces sp. NPDC005799 TaxID=3154678 RepID=UPI0033C382B8
MRFRTALVTAALGAALVACSSNDCPAPGPTTTRPPTSPAPSTAPPTSPAPSPSTAQPSPAPSGPAPSTNPSGIDGA